MQYKLVSIAVCTYNGAQFLIEQLDSLVNQTYPNLEIIVVDDCSSDDTINILKRYQLKYNFFSYIQNDHNLGYVKNFEKAIECCNGDYIALSDQDDIWDPDKIKLLVEHIGVQDLIYHDSSFIDGNGNAIPGKLSDVYPFFEGARSEPFFFYNCVSGHSILFKKQIVADIIPFDKRWFHDRWIAFIAAERGGIALLKKELVKYRQHTSSETDALKIHDKPIVADKFFSPQTIAWLRNCYSRSEANKNFLGNILSCFDVKDQLNERFRLFLLLLSRHKLLFFMVKKSTWSKINFIRKICFSSKHSN
jgi:glycosyltransferase involved in cell wall biosynthesis